MPTTVKLDLDTGFGKFVVGQQLTPTDAVLASHGLVDPRGTSQTCPECGTIKAKTLAEGEHRCDCDAVLDRDVAAAMGVHLGAFGFAPGHGVRDVSGRVAA